MSRTPETDALLAVSHGFRVEDAPRYSLWKPPGHVVGATIVETDADGGTTWRVNIHDDGLGDAIAAFLERHGAPTFPTVQERNAYIVELERGLRTGLPILMARDAALQAIGRALDGEGPIERVK